MLFQLLLRRRLVAVLLAAGTTAGIFWGYGELVQGLTDPLDGLAVIILGLLALVTSCVTLLLWWLGRHLLAVFRDLARGE